MRSLKILMLLFFVQMITQDGISQKPGFICGGFSLLGGWDHRSRNGTFLPSITLIPGVKFVQKKDFSVFAALPASFGISLQNDENSKTITYAGADLPLTLNMNIGGGFNKNSKSNTGFFCGAGMGYHISEAEIILGNEVIRGHLRFAGFMINAGPTFRVKTIRYRNKWTADQVFLA